MLLPFPDFRAAYFDFTEPNYSYVSTELLYKDEIIPIENRKYPSKNDRSVFSFKGKKNSFATMVENKFDKNEKVDTSGFLLTFNILDEILNNVQVT
jgi:hypothetical protein